MTFQAMANTTTQRNTLTLILSVAGLVAAFFLLNYKTLSWPFGIVDAPILIAQAILFSPIEYFTEPHAYDFLSFNNYTPLVTLSWDIDYTLFDLNESAYRAHQMISLLVLMILIYAVLFQATGSIAITTLFSFVIMNLPSTYSVLDVMVNRHYIEGMIFALLSYLAFKRYIHSQHLMWLIASVLCYGIATTAKEVYLPLPGILFFLGTRSLANRVYTIIPYAIALALYLGARFYIIGGSGGYTGAAETAGILENVNLLGLVALQVLGGLFSHPAVAIAVLPALLILLFLEFGKHSHVLKLAIVMGFIGALLPLLALLPMIAAGFVVTRWVFVPAVLLLLYLGYLCSRSQSKLIPLLVYVLLFSSSAFAAFQRMNAPDPLFAKGNGRNYKAIAASDEQSYVLFSNFSSLAAENFSVWVYIAKLRNGQWGTLPIVTPTQAAYHDLSDRRPIPMGRKARNPNFLSNQVPLRKNIVESGSIDENGLITVTFRPGSPSQRCAVYLFNEHNGIVLGEQSCEQWVSFHRQVVFQLRKAGLTIENTQLAVWSQDTNNPWRSEPYALADLLHSNTL